jgi:hypothetical protein
MRGFLDGFVMSTGSMTLYTTTKTDPYSTEIEYYFSNPDSPYSATYDSGFRWRGADIYPIGHQLFSHRFSQLWNSWWLSMIAPLAVTGYFSGPSTNTALNRYNIKNVTGTMTPDSLELHCHRGWFTVLIFHKSHHAVCYYRNDIPYRVSVLLRDSPLCRSYVQHPR